MELLRSWFQPLATISLKASIPADTSLFKIAHLKQIDSIPLAAVGQRQTFRDIRPRNELLSGVNTQTMPSPLYPRKRTLNGGGQMPATGQQRISSLRFQMTRGRQPTRVTKQLKLLDVSLSALTWCCIGRVCNGPRVLATKAAVPGQHVRYALFDCPIVAVRDHVAGARTDHRAPRRVPLVLGLAGRYLKAHSRHQGAGSNYQPHVGVDHDGSAVPYSSKLRDALLAPDCQSICLEFTGDSLSCLTSLAISRHVRRSV
jgi:hypothetical protein